MNRTQKPTDSAATVDDPSVVTPAVTLRGAAHYLETHGWIQVLYYAAFDAFPAACADGAIGMAAYGRKCGFPGETEDPGHRDYNAAIHYLVGYLDAEGHHVWPEPDPERFVYYGPDLFLWNDREGQTAETVIATLRAAADEWDWQHATEDDHETYAQGCYDYDTHPTREGFLTWLRAR